ncbi:transcriptional regulator GcvA [Motilimonas sp. E26]|uniref:transcriptional regulator GcvA n=1 Tax=Motilimonas sp. E26 TaxID=2865674 RepID=UPI001E4F9BC6|nr:transcriptional regulator GcvA [Motilimonas sp. E26]MCE0558514.1 transcriptional regulator GcvA [Motilimonas sp. E26]
MNTHLPPIMSLRCFESAAKHLSFTLAAQDLFITQAAVSQHIRNLEQQVGAPLFVRHSRRLSLTEQGLAFLPYVSQSLTLLADGMQKVSLSSTTGALNISALPSFCSRWLVPRLWHFLDQYPEIEVRLTPSLQVVDLAQSDFDLAIRFGLGEYPNCDSEALMSDNLFPVCSPKLLESMKLANKSLASAPDLTQVTIINDFLTTNTSWNTWLRAAGYPALKLKDNLSISDASLAITAAVSGQGVTLARQSLVGEELANGQLVRLFETSIASDYGYFLVTAKNRPVSEKAQIFRRWLQQQIAKDGNLCPPLQRELANSKIETDN